MPISQEQLDLCRLAMMIARLQLKAMCVTATALGNSPAMEQFTTLENQMDELSKQIQHGEIKGV